MTAPTAADSCAQVPPRRRMPAQRWRPPVEMTDMESSLTTTAAAAREG